MSDMNQIPQEQTNTVPAPKKSKKNNKKIIAIIIAVIVVVIAGVLIYKVSTTANPDKTEALYQELQTAVIDGKVDPYANNIDFEKLWETNEDIFAWITVPNTNVNYPVLTHETDGYYLNRTVDGKEGLPGSLFIEKYNPTRMTSPVTVIYGHNLKDNTMFSQLHKYEDKEFFDANPYFYIYLPDKTLKYQVFAAVAFDDRYILGGYELLTAEGFNEYIDDLNACMTGHINEDVDVKFGDLVVTLSTCISDQPSHRWLINGVLVDEKAK